jgi:hypothetical protein
MAYPSVLSTLATPQPTDRLNNPSHSTLHQNENSAILEIQRFVGLDGSSSVIGTLDYDIRSPASNGGGHVQTANKGGTGQTTYNKGDILVAQSASVLTKLSTGVDGQILSVNSSVATGLTWITTSSPKVAASASVVSVDNSSNETSIFAISIPPSILGINNAIKATLFVNSLTTANGVPDSLIIKANFGNTSIATLALSSIQNSQTMNGKITFDIIGAGSLNSQRAFMSTDMQRTVTPYNTNSSFVGMKAYVSNPVSVDAGSASIIGFTAKWNAAAGGTTFTVGGYEIEKLV